MGMMGKVLPIRLDLAQPNLRKFRDDGLSGSVYEVDVIPSSIRACSLVLPCVLYKLRHMCIFYYAVTPILNF